MNYRLSLLLLLLTGCQFTSPLVIGGPDKPAQTSVAFIWPNQLATDGCAARIQLQGNLDPGTQPINLTPTPATQPLLVRALNTIPVDPSTHAQRVLIRFRPTGRTVSIACGWGAQVPAQEIDVQRISPY